MQDNVMKNMTLKTRIAILALMGACVLIFAGCASIAETTHAYIGLPELAPTAPEVVQVYAAEPKQPKERLGEVILSIDGNPPRPKIEQTLKVAGAKLGADGVFVVSDKTHIYPLVYWDYWGPESSEDWHRLIVAVAFKNK
jgi:hypothetical protein